MTDTEINKAIAEFVGIPKHKWSEPIAEGQIGFIPQCRDCFLSWDEGGANDYCIMISLPNFVEDLNACHAMEKKLTGEQFLRYADELNKATKCFQHITPAVMACATARQRCEALLRTIGKWKE